MTLIGICILVACIFMSWKGLSNAAFFDGYKFEVGPILGARDFKRIISSGFLHVSWGHLVLNLFGLYAFGAAVESALGTASFLLIYFGSMIGGNLLALFIYRHHADYSSAGASGAICGLIFASTVLFPGMSLGIFLLPFHIPAWLYGLIYIAFTMWAIRSGRDNIGHEAHLGGALIGMLLAILMRPESLLENYVAILLITVPTILFIIFIIRRPDALLIDNIYYRKHKDFYSIDHHYNAARRDAEREMDRILDKISRSGMSSLSRQEREYLERMGG